MDGGSVTSRRSVLGFDRCGRSGDRALGVREQSGEWLRCRWSRTKRQGRAGHSAGGCVRAARELRNDGATVLLIEQDLRLAFDVCDDVAVMAKGQIVHSCTTPAFRGDPATAHRLLGVA